MKSMYHHMQARCDSANLHIENAFCNYSTFLVAHLILSVVSPLIYSFRIHCLEMLYVSRYDSAYMVFKLGKIQYISTARNSF